MPAFCRLSAVSRSRLQRKAAAETAITLIDEAEHEARTAPHHPLSHFLGRQGRAVVTGHRHGSRRRARQLTERAAELHGEELIGAHIKSASGGKTDLARIRQDASKGGYNPNAETSGNARRGLKPKLGKAESCSPWWRGSRAGPESRTISYGDGGCSRRLEPPRTTTGSSSLNSGSPRT